MLFPGLFGERPQTHMSHGFLWPRQAHLLQTFLAPCPVCTLTATAVLGKTRYSWIPGRAPVNSPPPALATQVQTHLLHETGTESQGSAVGPSPPPRHPAPTWPRHVAPPLPSVRVNSGFQALKVGQPVTHHPWGVMVSAVNCLERSSTAPWS